MSKLWIIYANLKMHPQILWYTPFQKLELRCSETKFQLCMWRGLVSHITPSNAQIPARCQIIEHNSELPRGSIRLRAQSYKTPLHLLQTPVTSPGCYTCFWPTAINQRFPWLRPQVWLICSSGSPNSEKLILTRSPVFFYKRI